MKRFRRRKPPEAAVANRTIAVVPVDRTKAEAKKRLATQQAIRKYATAMAATLLDLDPVLESAAIEELRVQFR
jgi:hypothetical protein